MITILRTNSSNEAFQDLVVQLDQDLAVRNGASNDFFAQYNKIDQLNHTVVAWMDNRAVGCGAMKEYAPKVMEIKRMFVPLVND